MDGGGNDTAMRRGSAELVWLFMMESPDMVYANAGGKEPEYITRGSREAWVVRKVVSD